MYIFDYLGAVYMWCFLALKYKIKRKQLPKFDEILSGKDRYNEDDVVDMHAYGLNLKIIGFSVTMIICYFLTKIRF